MEVKKLDSINIEYKNELLVPLSVRECYETLFKKIKIKLNEKEIFGEAASRKANIIAIKYNYKLFNYLQRKSDFEPVELLVTLDNNSMIIYESMHLALGDKISIPINL